MTNAEINKHTPTAFDIQITTYFLLLGTIQTSQTGDQLYSDISPNELGEGSLVDIDTTSIGPNFNYKQCSR